MMQRSLILAGLIGVFTAPVAASPFMSATLDMTTFRQSVIDTDPNDGIEASFVDQFNGRTVIACVALPLPAYCTEDVPLGG